LNLTISPRVKEKLLKKHDVTESDVVECFCDMHRKFLTDTREDHLTDPPTLWFIGETNTGKRLKVILIYKEGEIIIKSAFPPNEDEERIYALNAN